MAWRWTKLDENVDDTRVVRQLHDLACGAACATMLLRDRGIPADPLDVAVGLPAPSSPRDLAARLNALSRGNHQWEGGYLDIDPPIEPDVVRILGMAGSWAALLLPSEARLGHWVVVDGIGEGLFPDVAVRDPVGSSYRIPFAELCRLLWRMVAVFEGGGTI